MAQPLIFQFRAAVKRNDLPLLMRIDLQAVAPHGFEPPVRRFVELSAQAAWPLGDDLPQPALFRRLIEQTFGVYLVCALLKKNLLPSVERDGFVQQMVFDSRRSGVELPAGCGDDDRFAQTFDPLGQQIERAGFGRLAIVRRPVYEMQGKHIAGDLIGRAVGIQLYNVDAIAERGHAAQNVETERAAAGDLDRNAGRPRLR